MLVQGGATNLSAPPPPHQQTSRPIHANQDAIQQGLAHALTGPQQTPTSRPRTNVFGLKKRTRMETPSQLVGKITERTTKTPPTIRIQSLFPTSGTKTSLTKLIDNIPKAVMAAIIYGKKTKGVQVDISSAANLLLLIGEVHCHHHIYATTQSIFPTRQTYNPSSHTHTPCHTTQKTPRHGPSSYL